MVDYKPTITLTRDMEYVGGACRSIAAGEVLVFDVSKYSAVVIVGAGGYGDALKMNFCADSACTTQKFASDIYIATEYNATYPQSKLAGAPVDPAYPWLKLVNSDTVAHDICVAVFGVR